VRNKQRFDAKFKA